MAKRRGRLVSYHFSYLARTYTRRTDTGVAYLAVELDSDLLEIRQPPALRRIVRVADRITRHRPFFADITFAAHCIDLPYELT